VKLVLAGHGWAGSQVLRQAVAHPDIEDVYLVTHEPAAWMADIRDTASELGIAWTTESINTAHLPFAPDVISSVWYRSIIRPHVIDSVAGRIFNLHPSLLPRHRGCSSVPWAMIEGDAETGVTAHYIDSGVDTGRVLYQERVQITDDETQSSLYDKCLRVAAMMWSESLRLVVEGSPGVEQEGHACHHPRGAPYGGRIDESWDDGQVELFVRAMTFPPLPYATYRGREIKSFAAYRGVSA
jgi:methionyl-tRNA formyltransferase